MNAPKIIEELKKQYPGKKIILNDPRNPTEIICEVEPTDTNPEKSVSIAVMDENIKHCHRIAKEIYEVLEGTLELTKEGKTYFLTPGQSLEIKPMEYHMANGRETWVKVTSEPGWSPEDNYNYSDNFHDNKLA